MRTKVSISLALGLFFAGVALAAEATGEPPTSVERPACPAPGSMTLASLGVGDAIPTAGEQIGAAACCESDPCPATGEPVSCCEEGCSAWSDRVWCSSTGFIYCPEEDPCEQDGQCNTSCGCDDPDCAACHQGTSCAADSDCDPCGQGFGFCDKETWERVGTCSCAF